MSDVKLPSKEWRWVSPWMTHASVLTDDEGWRYAFAFQGPFTPTPGAISWVRQRLWLRKCQREGLAPLVPVSVNCTAPKLTQNVFTGKKILFCNGEKPWSDRDYTLKDVPDIWRDATMIVTPHKMQKHTNITLIMPCPGFVGIFFKCDPEEDHGDFPEALTERSTGWVVSKEQVPTIQGQKFGDAKLAVIFKKMPPGVLALPSTTTPSTTLILAVKASSPAVLSTSPLKITKIAKTTTTTATTSPPSRQPPSAPHHAEKDDAKSQDNSEKDRKRNSPPATTAEKDAASSSSSSAADKDGEAGVNLADIGWFFLTSEQKSHRHRLLTSNDSKLSAKDRGTLERRVPEESSWGALQAGGGWWYIFSSATQNKLGTDPTRPGALLVKRRGNSDNFKWRAQLCPGYPLPAQKGGTLKGGEGAHPQDGISRSSSAEWGKGGGFVCFLINKASQQRLCIGRRNPAIPYALWGDSERFRWRIRRVPPVLEKLAAGRGGGVREEKEKIERKLLMLRAASRPFKCPLCLCNNDRLTGVRLRCEHTHCVDCLTQYIDLFIQRNQPFKCAIKTCEAAVRAPDIIALLTAEQAKKYKAIVEKQLPYDITLKSLKHLKYHSSSSI
uniref:Uncharacterized protein n=1 Tax=Lotharella globosa TaxID=91324 RepID=A0A7S3YU22_9EUKA